MRALDHGGEVQHEAKRSPLFVQRDVMSAQSRHAGRFHAGRAAADDHDLLLGLRLGNLIGCRAAFTHDSLGQRVDTAVAEHRVHLIGAGMAVQTAGAGGNFVNTALAQLVDVLHVDGKRTVHQEEVQLSVLQCLLEEVRRMGGIHIGHRAHRDAQFLLIAGGDVQRDAAAAGVADGRALEVAAEVILGAEAGRALDPVEDEVQVRGKLGNMVAERSDAQVHGVAACLLKELGCRDSFLDHERLGMRRCDIRIQGHDGRVVGDVVVFLNTVDQALDCHIRTVGLQLGQDLRDKTGPVFNALAAVLILTGVVEAGEEVRRHIESRTVELDDLEPDPIEAFGDLNHPGLSGVDLLHRHLVLSHAEAGNLIAEDRAVFRAAFYQLIQILQGFRVILSALRNFQEVDCFDKDQLHTALGKVEIILEQFVGLAGQVSRGTGRGFHHAVIQADVSDLEGGEQRLELQIGGTEFRLIKLRIEIGLWDLVQGFEGFRRGKGFPFCRSRRREARKHAHRAYADRTGRDSFQEISA